MLAKCDWLDTPRNLLITGDSGTGKTYIANALLLNKDIHGTTMHYNDVDYYAFDIPSDGYFSVSFQHDYVEGDERNYWKLTVYNSTNDELINSEYKGITTAESTTTKLGIPAGKYYVKVSAVGYYNHADEAYKLRINYTKSNEWETEFNDTFNTSDALLLNKDIHGTTMHYNDADYYAFDIPSDGAYIIAFSHDYVEGDNRSYWKITAFNSTNDEISNQEYQGKTTSASEKEIDFKKGRNYVKISAIGSYNHSDVEYVLKISPKASANNQTDPTDKEDKPSDNKNNSSGNTTINYVDIRISAWYYSGVKYATAKGYMTGIGNNRFNPDGTVTRGTIAQILYAAEGKPSVTGSAQFTDVKTGKWYANAVNWAAKKGLVSGYGNGKFGPDDAITREQMVAIMLKYSAMKGYDTSTNADLGRFPDQNRISKYAVAAIKWGVSHSIISGTNNGIEPKGKATRAQIAVILQAYDKHVRK